MFKYIDKMGLDTPKQLKECLKQVKHFALDMDGTIYNGGTLFPFTIPFLEFLKENGIRTHVLKKISEDADEIPDAIRQGHIAYVINTKDIGASTQDSDGQQIRRLSTENNVTIFTSIKIKHSIYLMYFQKKNTCT